MWKKKDLIFLISQSAFKNKEHLKMSSFKLNIYLNDL